MYITEAIVHYYRGFKHEVITFTDGLNVIYGNGDAGKSALEKAIRWCLLNEKQSNYINKNTKTPNGEIKSKFEVYVQITFNTGDIIRRVSTSKTHNLYYVTRVGIPEEEWSTKPIRKWDDAIPEEITNIVNLSSLNVCKQFDPHFLLAAKGSDVSKELNKMVNLEIIDTSTANMINLVNKLKKNKDNLEFNLKKYEQDLTGYSFLDKMDVDLEEIENLDVTFTGLSTDINNVSSIKEKVLNLRKDRMISEETLTFKPHVARIQALTNELEELHSSIGKVSAMASYIKENKNKKVSLEHIISYKENVEDIIEKQKALEKMECSTDSLIELRNKIETIIKERSQLNNIISFKSRVQKIETLQNECDDLNNDLDKIDDLATIVETERVKQIKLKKIIKTLKDSLGDELCPTCGKPFKED